MIHGTTAIDVDSHVEEDEATWNYLDPEYAARRPIILNARGQAGLTQYDAFWMVDGRTWPKPVGHGAMVAATPPVSTRALNKPYSVGSQSLADMEARIGDLDRLGLDVQVLFPTIFLLPLTEDLAFEAALMSSYNRWIAERCSQHADRLKWVAVLPWRSPAAAVEELRRAQEQGAIGVATLGTIGPRMLHEPEFDPIWAEAERLDLPVGVHTGWPHPGLNASCDTMWAAHVLSFTVPVMMGFFSVLGGGVLDRHPGLRVGFFEAGADWLPFMLQRMEHYYGGDGAPGMGRVSAQRPSKYVERGQVYFTCEGDEALLPQVLTFLGDDYMMASGDVPHAEARDNCMEEIAEREDISEEQKRKILGENARRFYKLK